MEDVWTLIGDLLEDQDEAAIGIMNVLHRNGYCRLSYGDFMNELHHIQNDDPWEEYLFGSNSVPNPAIHVAGSASEGLSLGYTFPTQKDLITEMDFMFIFGQASQNSTLIMEATADPGFFNVRIRSPDTVSGSFLHQLCEKRNDDFYLSPTKAVEYMAQLVRRVFVNCKIKTHSPEHAAEINCPVVTVKFDKIPRPGQSGSPRDLMLDIAPVLMTDMTTADVNLPCLTRYQKKQVSQQRVLLVAKSNQDSLQWRSSTSLAEREIFKNLTYRSGIAHVLLSAKVVKTAIISADSKLKSYHLKTALLYRLSEIRSRDDTNWRDVDTTGNVVDLYLRINDYLQKGHMPHFFNASINLLSDVDRNTVQQISELTRGREKFFSKVDLVLQSLSPIRILYDDHEGDFVTIENGPQPMTNVPEISAVVTCVDSGPMSDGLGLIEASCLGMVTETKILLSHADVINRADEVTSALYHACHFGHVDIARLLLAHGADVAIPRNGETPLHIATKSDHLSVANLLLEAGAEVNVLSTDLCTPLWLAVYNGSADMVSLLLQYNADVAPLCGKDGESCMHIACAREYTNLAEILQQHGACVNSQRHYDGATALHLAASYGHVETVRWLLNNGADLGIVENKDFQTPISTAIVGIERRIGRDFDDPDAVVNDARQIVELLLEKGASVNVLPNYASPLVAAAGGGYFTIVDLLLRNGADVNFAFLDGRTPLILASMTGALDIVELLTKHGANPDTCDENGRTSLFIASANGFDGIVRFLAKSGADVNRPDIVGDYPLTRTSRDGHLAVVKALLDGNALVNVKDSTGYTALNIAARNGASDLVKLLIDHEADVNIPCNDVLTPLQSASYRGHFQVVELLLTQSAMVNVQNTRDGSTALHYAVHSSNLAIVERLKQSNANVNLLQIDGTSCLHLACIYGNYNVAKFLLENGADIDCPRTRDSGARSLHLAAARGHLDIVRLLLEHSGSADVKNDSDVDQCMDDGATALHCAAGSGQIHIVDLLLKFGSYVDLRNKEGKTALFCAAECGHSECVSTLLDANAAIDCRNDAKHTPLLIAVNEGHANVVRVLCENGAEMNVTTDTGQTLLMLATYRGYSDVVKALLEYGAFVNVQDKDGLSTLQIASSSGQADIVELLLQNGANVNDVQNGETAPLYAAAQLGHTRIVELLLEAGACVDIPLESNGKTALQQAAFSGWLEIVKLLLKHNADVSRVQHDGTSSLHSAAFKGRLDIATVLLENGVNIKWQRSSDGATAVHLAAQEGYVDVVKLLLDNHLEVSVNVRSNDGATPLYLASQNGQHDVVSLLVRSGADCNVARYDTATPLGIAAQNGHYHCVLQLLNCGADVNVQDEDGDTPLIAAAYGGHKNVVLLLLDHGANPGHRNIMGHTALSMAASQNHFDVVGTISTFEPNAENV